MSGRRPRYDDFALRCGEVFQVTRMDCAGVVQTWRLASCERLPAKSGTDDGFRMVFECAQQTSQDSYHLQAADGFEQTLFAVPGGTDWMHVTVN